VTLTKIKRNHLRLSPRAFEEAVVKGQIEYCSYSGKRWDVGQEIVVRLRGSEISIDAVCLDKYYDRDGFCIMVVGLIPGPVKKL
jgi:hypothetical protein